VHANIDGFELASLIAVTPCCERTAIIFISAHPATNLDQIKGTKVVRSTTCRCRGARAAARTRALFADLYRRPRRLSDQPPARTACRRAHAAWNATYRRKRLQEALQHPDRRKDEFLAVLAHELRNPLARSVLR